MNWLRNWKKYAFFIFIVMIIAAVALYYHYRRQPMAAKPFVMPPTVVSIAQVEAQRWPQILQGTGTVTAQQGVIIRAQVAGQVLKQYVSSSSDVASGTPLYQIDPQGLAQLIQQNQAQLALKIEQLAEKKKLYKQRYLAKNEYDVAKADYQVALNALAQNQRKLALTQVTAPFAGTLGVMLVHQGDFVNVNDPLVSLQNTDRLRVDFTLPGNEANLAQKGQKVVLEVLQYPQRTFSASVTSVNASVSPESQSILLRAYLDKAAQTITPGSFANVQLYVQTNSPVLTVPQTALVYSDSGTAVYRVIKGVAHLTPVTPGQRLDNRVAITSSLKAGDAIVSEGKVKLMSGSRVTSAMAPTTK